MANKAIFFDRDDTLIEDPGYITNPDQVKLLDGVPESLIELRTMGYKLVVVTNQSAVARGMVTEEGLEEIHNRLKHLLAEKGAYLDRIYYCPYHPEAVIPKYRKEWYWRKPNPGMLLAAADELDIDLGQSWMVGNQADDIEAGQRANCKTIFINHSRPKPPEQGKQSKPDYEAVNIKEAVNIIKKHVRSFKQSDDKVQPIQKPQSPPPPQPSEKPVQQEQPDSQSDIPEPVEPEAAVSEPNYNAPAPTTEQLLYNILEELKNMQRQSMFREFSIFRLMAGIVQIIVPFCLLICVWFLMSPTRQDSDKIGVLISLGFAAVFQLMALTFYIMQDRG